MRGRAELRSREARQTYDDWRNEARSIHRTVSLRGEKSTIITARVPRSGRLLPARGAWVGGSEVLNPTHARGRGEGEGYTRSPTQPLTLIWPPAH